MDSSGPFVPRSGMDESLAQPPYVALLALPQSTTAALVGLYEVLASAGTAWPELTDERTGACALAPRIVSCDGAPAEPSA